MTSTSLPGLGPVVGAQIRYQLTLLLRTPRALLLSLIFPGLLLALEVGRHRSGTTSAQLTAAMAGLVVFGTLSVSYVTYAIGLVTARETGTLRRWRLTPLPAWGYFAGRIAATLLLADASGVVLVLVGTSMAGLHLTAGGLAALLVADTLGSLTLALAGTAITPLLTSVQGANPVLVFTYIPLLIFSGGFGSVNSLPHWLTTTMSYFPVQPVVDAVNRALVHTGGGTPLLSARDLAVLASWAVACLLLASRFFRWDPSRPRHARDTAQRVRLKVKVVAEEAEFGGEVAAPEGLVVASAGDGARRFA